MHCQVCWSFILCSLCISHPKSTGPIPESILNLSNLETLVLSNNALKGPLPSAIAKLPNLRYLDLSVSWHTGNSNHFNQAIPAAWFREDSKLQRIFLANAGFSGDHSLTLTLPWLPIVSHVLSLITQDQSPPRSPLLHPSTPSVLVATNLLEHCQEGTIPTSNPSKF